MKPTVATNQNVSWMRWISIPSWGPELVLCISVVLTIQYWLGAYSRDLATDPDEAAHFVSGVMVRDYLLTALGSPPMEFAEEYYLHYPKVAIGHWPPGFYAVQGIWYSLVGVSKTNAALLVGLISVGIAWCLYRRLSRHHGKPIALVTVSVFLVQPLVLSHHFLIMSDMVTCLGMLLSAYAFSDFLEAPKGKSAASFVFWSSLSILTKPSAIALAGFVPVCVLVSGQFRVLKNWRFWVAGAAIGILTAPYYLWTWDLGMGLHTHGNLGQMIGESVRAGRRYHASDAWLSATSGWVVAVAVVGCLSHFVTKRRQTTDCDAGRFDFAAAIALCCGTILFLFAAPIDSSRRYFFPFLMGLMIIYARGLETLISLVPGRNAIAWTGVGFLAVLTVVTAPGRVHLPVNGYASAAESLGDPQLGRVTLISSNSAGEGAFVAERLLRDRDRSEFVLRASKVLATTDWSERRYENRFSTPEQLRDFINSAPVRFIVVDDFGYRNNSEPPHHVLLKKLLIESPDEFLLLSSLPVALQGQQHANAIRIYENIAARDKIPKRIELNMNSSLRKTLQFESRNPDN
ncbi:MAG: glycosyltransferase family 39 protein [Planctomycetota bacterium]|nr:glycosyltransferase family 39 protein [Planctomycetota bacterium]